MSARVFDCPSCGAALKFTSSVAVFAVCEFCRSMVVLRDARVENLGTMAELPPDLSPLQIGTRGVWNGQGFELVGRVRLEWAQGSWSEWCAVFGDNRIGWVAEAQGYYMVTMEVPAGEDLPRLPGEYSVGMPIRLDQSKWSVVDIKEATCIAADGELPFLAPPGSARLSIDLAGVERGFATIELSGSELAVFTGDYAQFEELQFSNLRPVPGWNAEVEAARNRTITLNCLNCGAPVNFRAAGQTMSIVCGSCGTVIDTANPQATVIQQADEAIRDLKLILPIGTRGLFRGTDYEVIGFARRKDAWAAWDEYLLFNPWKGFRWLVTFNGHWSFIEPLLEIPKGGTEKRLRDGRKFALFARAQAEIVAVLGEFYWKVRRGEFSVVSDYVSPPWVLSMEHYPGLVEQTWSAGVYVEPEDVRKAFGLTNLLPPRGIYLNQPNPHRTKWDSVKWTALAAIVIYVVVQYVFLVRGGRHQVFSGTFQFDRTAAGKVITSPKFKIPDGSRPVWIKAGADVDNNWLGLDVDLVNASTNETASADLGVEYYHGYDDGNWEEGSKAGKTDLPGVPAGEYMLNIEAEADPAIAKMPFTVTVESGGIFWSNFWLGLVLLLIYPVWVYFRRRSFEVSRWSESDYSPYASSQDDE